MYIIPFCPILAEANNIILWELLRVVMMITA